LFWSNFIMLIGAEINAKLLQQSGKASLLRKDRWRAVTLKAEKDPDLAA